MEKFIWLVWRQCAFAAEVEISGAKNAAVAILPATVLIDGVCRIENIPSISDDATTLKILKSLGSQVRYINKNTVEIGQQLTEILYCLITILKDI